jgi:hypothetical protein
MAMERPARVAARVLAAGLATAVVIYATAAPPDDSPAGGAEITKQYLRQMETYGGTSNVLASGFREWFAGLWHGRELAFTVACLSVVLAGFVLVQLTPASSDDARATGRRIR